MSISFDPQAHLIVLCEQFACAKAYAPVILNHHHIGAMESLQKRCGSENVVPRDAAYYRAHFAQGHKAIGMINHQGILVAHALVHNSGDETKMLNVLVDPEHRGQGLHSKMIDKWLNMAVQDGYKTATARVRLSAMASYKNFSNAGFQSVRCEPSPDAPHEMTHWMEKSLKARRYLHEKLPHLESMMQ